MEKMKLKDGTIIEYDYSFGMTFFATKYTIDELESKLTKDNLTSVEFTTNSDGIFGIYNNLELMSISKNYITKEISIELV
ncbi:hypothetical protein CB452P1_000028 [Clostridium phage CB452P1]|nr:hypothetical protein CB452P1_000028 [Clostridium phage CB452P1]